MLFVGSHNLTLSGLSHNRELTNRFEVADDKDQSQIASLRDAWTFLRAWIRNQPEELQVTFQAAEGVARWLSTPTSTDFPSDVEQQFFGVLPEGPTLWDIVKTQIPTNIHRITVVAPFFDRKLTFLRKLTDAFSPKQFIVGVEPELVEISRNAQRVMPNARFVDANCLHQGKGYLHAKAVLFETNSGSEVLITGSANASQSAWLARPAERNAEAVVVRRDSRRQSLSKELGFRELATQPTLTDEAWKRIKLRITPTQKDSTTVHHVPLIAVETDEGFEIETNTEIQSTLVEALLLDQIGNSLGKYSVMTVENGVCKVDVAELELRNRTSLIVLLTDHETQVFAIAHHTFDLAASARSKRQRELRHALENLADDTTLLEDMLRIVERVIFDEGYQYVAAGERKNRSRQKQRDQPEQVIQTSFAASRKDARPPKQVGHFISAGDLGLLLDALNKRLGIGLEAELSTGVSIARSEEEIIGADEEETEEYEEVDGAALARTCQRKVRTLMRRMTRQLERAGILKDISFEVIAQLAAVLGILHRLRELEHQVAWIPPYETLIPHEAEWQFFLDATRLLYSQREAVMEGAINSRQSNVLPAEISMALGLLLWLAWDCALDIRSLREIVDRDELRKITRGIARLVKMAPQLCDDATAQRKADDAIKRLGSYDQERSLTEKWYEEHLQWLRKIAAASHDPRRTKLLTRMSAPGDLAYPTLAKFPRLSVVLESTGSLVRLVDLDKENELNSYGSKYISLIDIGYQ